VAIESVTFIALRLVNSAAGHRQASHAKVHTPLWKLPARKRNQVTKSGTN